MPDNPTLDTPPSTMTDTVLNYLADQARQHGLSVVLLGLAVWYFQGETTKLANEIKACNQTIIDVYRTDRLRNMEVISNNTKALEEIKTMNR